MVEQRKKTHKKVVWANAAGKPLTNTRFINKEGRSLPLTQQVRQFKPANLTAIAKKHEAALQRAKDRVRLAEKKVEGLKTNAKTMDKFEKMTRVKYNKAIKPAEVANLKNKLYKLNKTKATYAQRMADAKLNLNEVTNRLSAQRKAVVKEKAGFKLFGKK
jgi:hypothetical protein